MKKLLLSSVIALMSLSAIPVSAQWEASPNLRISSPQANYISKKLANTDPAKAPASRAEAGTLELAYCDDYAGSIGAGPTTQYGAIEIPLEVAKGLEGDKITKINIGFGKITQKNVKIFITKKLGATPIYSEDVTIAREGWNEYTLKTPYPIGKEGFFIGYEIKITNEKDYPIGVDGKSAVNAYSDYIGLLNQKDGKTYFGHMYEFGLNYNVCIKATVEGDKIPQNDISLDNFNCQRVVEANKPFVLECQLTNKGAKPITSIELAYQIGDMEPATESITFDGEALQPNKTGYLPLQATCPLEGIDLPIAVLITKVNGQDDDMDYNNGIGYNYAISSVKKTYERNVVVEEGTGTWCGWCPMGIAGMEYMNEHYGDGSFIGIAVHQSTSGFGGKDPMEAKSYLQNQYSGFPSSHINRYYFDVPPYPEYLEMLYEIERETPAYGQVYITDVNIADGKANITTKSQIGADIDNAEYRLAFVLIENNVGPYKQSNNCTDRTDQNYYGYENKPSKFEMLYNDVARDIFTYEGIEGSLPSTIKGGQIMEYSYTANLTKVTDVTNMEIAVLMINPVTEEIVNATKWKYGQAGVNDLVAEENGTVAISAANGAIEVAGDFDTVQVYTIDGRQVANTTESTVNVPAGLYIVKAADTVQKVIVK